MGGGSTGVVQSRNALCGAVRNFVAQFSANIKMHQHQQQQQQLLQQRQQNSKHSRQKPLNKGLTETSKKPRKHCGRHEGKSRPRGGQTRDHKSLDTSETFFARFPFLRPLSPLKFVKKRFGARPRKMKVYVSRPGDFLYMLWLWFA